MAGQDFDAKEIEARLHSLSEAMDRVRDAQAERDDVVVEMKQAARARLELLVRDLQPAINEVPEDASENFDFAISGGETPRFWIDAVSHVRMARDRRVYEFVRDTRLGRTVLARSTERNEIAHSVTTYVAERLIERNKVLEGDWTSFKAARHAEGPAMAQAMTSQGNAVTAGWLHVVTFGLGLAAGVIALLSWAWFA